MTVSGIEGWATELLKNLSQEKSDSPSACPASCTMIR